MTEWNLNPREKEFSADYDRGLNPSIFNGFTTAAFR